MDTTQQELIAALARRLNGHRTPLSRRPARIEHTDEPADELDVLIDLEAPADDVIDLTGR